MNYARGMILFLACAGIGYVDNSDGRSREGILAQREREREKNRRMGLIEWITNAYCIQL